MAVSASNVFAVESQRTQAIDYSNQYAPTTQSYHGFSIQVVTAGGAGVTIGRITEWTPLQMSRPATLVRELNADTYGQPVDIVPGVEENFTLAFARAEVWGAEIEVAFGVGGGPSGVDPYMLLVNQNQPFIVDEVYMKGNTVYRQIRYLGCWFTSKNTAQFTAEGGDSIIKVDGEIMFVNRLRII